MGGGGHLLKSDCVKESPPLTMVIKGMMSSLRGKKRKTAVVIDAGGGNRSKLTREPCMAPGKVEESESGAPDHSVWAQQ